MLLCEPGNDFLPLADVVVDLVRGLHEWLAEHQLELRIHRFSFGDKLVIDLLILIERDAFAAIISSTAGITM